MGRRLEFGKNWWAKRWIAALEAFGWDNRLQRGRSYASGGRVRSIGVSGDGVVAKVQGSDVVPYTVAIHLRILKPEEWEKVLQALASQALFAAKLLAGEMPEDVEDAFRAAGVPLFPSSTKDLKTSCSCPDWANPCKHVAAVHYVLGEEFDRNPFLLFELRGRSKEQVLEALRAGRAEAEAGGTEGASQPEAASHEVESPPLEASLDRFWALGEDLSPLLAPAGRRQAVEGVLRLLGPIPFAKEGSELSVALSQVYERVAKRARKVARGGNGADLGEKPGED